MSEGNLRRSLNSHVLGCVATVTEQQKLLKIVNNHLTTCNIDSAKAAKRQLIEVSNNISQLIHRHQIAIDLYEKYRKEQTISEVVKGLDGEMPHSTSR